MNNGTASPLVGPPPDEVPLDNAPLVRVIAQARFPLLLAIRSADSMAPFQEAVRGAYPILNSEQTFSVVMGEANAPPDIRPEVIWRFRDAKGAWILSVTSEFLSLEALAYTSRKDFVERFRVALVHFARIFRPQQVTRLGLRYVDRVQGPNVDRLRELVDEKVLGLQQAPYDSAIESSITQMALRTAEGQLHARWGLIPPGATPDPAVLPAIDGKSWILDLDLFTQDSLMFDADALSNLSLSFSQRIYAMFRSIVKDEFLRAYGGKP